MIPSLRLRLSCVTLLLLSLGLPGAFAATSPLAGTWAIDLTRNTPS